jgi:hypothetical protein
MRLSCDLPVQAIDLAMGEGLFQFLEMLTGQTVPLPDEANEAGKRLAACADQIGKAGIGLPELNELLILLGQNRISKAFFEYFFGPEPRVDANGLKEGLSNFRMWAMLRYGNFRYPYQTWRKAVNQPAIEKTLGGLARRRKEIEPEFVSAGRTASITRIDPAETYVTGVLAVRSILRDLQAATSLCKELQVAFDTAAAEQACLNIGLIRDSKALRPSGLEQRELKWAKEHWSAEQARSVADHLNTRILRLPEIRARAIRHTTDYLLADKMDVYVATSMRETWEFEETAADLEEMFESGKYGFLSHLDYFDPTQSYTNTIDKGLVEGLMLHRARATVYMAQESDTLGKDSELASTLAQGKPVIAYVPQLADLERKKKEHKRELQGKELDELDKWIDRFRRRPIPFFRKRLNLLEAADILTDPYLESLCLANGAPGPEQVFEAFNVAYRDFTPFFRSVPHEHEEFRKQHSEWFDGFVRCFAFAEAVNFEKRALTLKKNHPLGMQLNVRTGVANGVLVVRALDKCASLLEEMLLNDASFRIEEEKEETEQRDVATVLIEEISESRYRAVTEDQILTASFWNFFRPG